MASSSSSSPHCACAIVSCERPKQNAGGACRNWMSVPPQALSTKLDSSASSSSSATFRLSADVPFSRRLASNLAAAGAFPAPFLYPASAFALNSGYPDGGSTVETAFQFGYLGGLVLLLGGGSYLIIRQILRRRELELAAKELQERARTGQASPVEYYELGAIMLRKKLYPVARKYLELAIKKWEDDEQDLAQVYNALGFCYFSDNKVDLAISSYEKAVTLAPGYTVGWNNLGNAFEKKKDWQRAKDAYEQTLRFEPNNSIAVSCMKIVKEKMDEAVKVTNA